MHQPTPAVGQHNEHEQDSKGRGRYREEIQRNEIRGVVLQECSPRLRRRPPRADHVLRHRRLRDRQAELQQLAVDPRRTPERIRAAHLPNQISQVPPNCGPTVPPRSTRDSTTTPRSSARRPCRGGRRGSTARLRASRARTRAPAARPVATEYRAGSRESRRRATPARERPRAESASARTASRASVSLRQDRQQGAQGEHHPADPDPTHEAVDLELDGRLRPVTGEVAEHEVEILAQA